MWPFSGRRGSEGLGPRGEKIACTFLKRRGMKILAANYRCPAGEADLIALDRSTRAEAGAETIAFVEVKTRRTDRDVDPESAVNAEKRRRIRKVADYYLNTHDAEDYNARFDVVSVVVEEGQEPRVKHTPDAF